MPRILYSPEEVRDALVKAGVDVQRIHHETEVTDAEVYITDSVHVQISYYADMLVWRDTKRFMYPYECPTLEAVIRKVKDLIKK